MDRRRIERSLLIALIVHFLVFYCSFPDARPKIYLKNQSDFIKLKTIDEIIQQKPIIQPKKSQ